jgi:osmotically-inducible protein OsmY
VKATDVKDVRPQRGTGSRGWLLVAGGLLGALTAFFADPERGNARRKEAVDRIGGFARHTTHRAERVVRGVKATATGWSRKLTHLRVARRSVDDSTLRDRVESELFRDPEVPKGNINLDVAGGRVTLRGQVKWPEQIRELQSRVARMPGVQNVQSFLHLEGTEAPNKAEVRDIPAGSETT